MTHTHTHTHTHTCVDEPSADEDGGDVGFGLRKLLKQNSGGSDHNEDGGSDSESDADMAELSEENSSDAEEREDGQKEGRAKSQCAPHAQPPVPSITKRKTFSVDFPPGLVHQGEEYPATPKRWCALKKLLGERKKRRAKAVRQNPRPMVM